MGILDTRVAIVTGASSGVGQGCALRFGEEGATVVGCARRVDKLEDLVRDIEAKGGRAVAVGCDVASQADFDKVVTTAVERFGRIDILANIAQGGITDTAPLDAITAEEAMSAFVTGPLQSLRFMQQCLPHMRQRGYGRIINTASHAALVGEPGRAPYEMAKERSWR